MDAREIEILRYLEGGPALVQPVLNQIPRSSAYRLLRRLQQDRLVAREGRRYRLLPAGRDALAALDVPPIQAIPAPSLDRYIPHLRHAPTAFHRAVLELVACAIVARQHRLRVSHHPAFVVFGPKLRWKTWLARAACLIAGIDPACSVIYLGVESGRSMLSRKGAKGQRLSLRAALDQPVVGLDEWLRAKPEVRRLAQVYLHGEITVPDENEVLTIRPVAIMTLNPRDGKHALDERLGLDEPMLRRSILADVSEVEIPPDLLTEGDALLDRIRAQDPAEFPPPRRSDWEPREEVKRRLLDALDAPERLAGIDVTMVAMLATAATAWLEPEVALHLVLSDYLTVVEQLGWTKSNWRSEMEVPLDQKTDETDAPLSVPEPNPLDYDQKLHALAEVCSRLSIAPAQAEERLRHVEKLAALGFGPAAADLIAAELKRIGLAPAEAAKRLADCLREHESLEASRVALEARVRALEEAATAGSQLLEAGERAVAALGWSPERGRALRTLDDELRRSSLSVADATTVAAAAREVAAATGADPADGAVLARHLLGLLAAEIQKQGETDRDLDGAVGAILAAARRSVRLDEEVQRLDVERRRLDADAARARSSLNALQSQVEETRKRKAAVEKNLAILRECIAAEQGKLDALRQRHAAVTQQHRAMQADIAFASQFLQFLSGRADPYDELWRRMAELIRAQAVGTGGPQLDELADATRRRLIEILKSGVEKDLVSQWDLDRYRADAKEAAARDLRARFEPVAKNLLALEEAVRSKREEADRALDHLRWID